MYWKDYINTYNEKKGEKPFSITDGERYVKLSKCWYDNGQLERDHSPTRAWDRNGNEIDVAKYLIKKYSTDDWESIRNQKDLKFD